jgi:hypothetical protein
MTIADSFSNILSRCDFTEPDRTAFATHRREIETRLKNTLAVSKVEVIGSYARASAIRQTSDIDLLVVLRNSEWQWGGSRKNSSTVLYRVREQLISRYPNTAIGRDGQAIVVTFSDGKSVDVVPSGWVRAQSDGWPVYIIPDRGGNWRETAPDRHSRYVADADVRSGGKLKNVARIFKYWKACRVDPVPVGSFHVELLMAAEGLCGVGSSYADCFAALLQRLARRECRALQDPLGISGLVPACSTDAKRAMALRTVTASADRANGAVAAGRNGNVTEARRLWNLVFNDRFPR